MCSKCVIIEAMNPSKPQFYFLLTILIATFVLAFFVIRPLLYPLILAMVLAVLVEPIHRRLLRGMPTWPGLASLLTIVIVALFILVPLVFLGFQVSEESQQLYHSLVSGQGKMLVADGLTHVTDRLQVFFPRLSTASISVDTYIEQAFQWTIHNLGTVFSSVARLIAGAFICLLALFYMLRDGKKLRERLVALSPLADTDDKMILKKLEAAINSVIRGNLLVAVIQGTLAAIGFSIFGVPNAILWGSLTAVAALIPAVGTAAVVFPSVAFLFFTSSLGPALGLLAWGICAVGLIDNFIGPKLIGERIQLHPLIVLLSVLGGLAFFGPIGFLLGPLTVSLLFALLDIYFSAAKRSA